MSTRTTSWRITGKSTFDGRVAWIDYRSNHFAERDFSGLAGRLRYSWIATAKLALQATLSQEVEPWSDASETPLLEPPGFLLGNYGPSTAAVTLADFPGGNGHCAAGASLQRDEAVPPDSAAAWSCGKTGGTPGRPP